MSQEDESALAIPSLQEDSAERRRVLNVLAQRRYRRRKREKVQILEAQVQMQQQNHAITPTSTDTAAPQMVPRFDFTNTPISFAPTDDSGTTDVPFGTLNLPSISDTTSLLPDPLDDSFFWMPDPNLAPIPPAAATTSSSSSSSTIPPPNDDFADYIITTPGLSVIRAHTEIYTRLLGPGFDLDIFDPAAISPISRGAAVQPTLLLRHFAPTPLQRRVAHHPIVDVLPWPSFRDRFLYVMSLREELRPRIARKGMPEVTLELMLAVKDAGGGVRVWDCNGFEPESWEIGQVFYSRFWWAIDESVVRTSNRHRELRGERRLDRRDLFIG